MRIAPTYFQGWGRGLVYAVVCVFVSELISIISFLFFQATDQWLGSFWNLIPGTYQLIVTALLILSFWISFKLVQWLFSSIGGYFLAWGVGWYVIITGGWLLYRDIFLNTIDGSFVTSYPLDEILSVALSATILAVSTYMFMGGQFISIQTEVGKLWKRFYATWLS